MLVPTIGDLLSVAIGVALSPIPIITIVLMLGTPRARANGPAFALGWILGLVVVAAIVLLIAGGADDPDSTASDGANWLKVLIGVLFLALAVKQWRSRPRAGEEAELPAWMATVDTFTPARSFGLGALLSGANPKNLALTAAAGATIAQADLDTGGQVVAVAVYVVLASLTVAGPVIAYLVATDRTSKPLAAIKEFMAAHNAVIMMVVLLILGMKLLGQGMSGLAT